MERMSRLPGRSIKHFGWGLQRHQLWMAETHLLYREISGYREDVKRFHYQDIQAIICTPTDSWKTCNWIAGLLLFFMALIAAIAAVTGYAVSFVIAWIAATIALAILLGNLVLGATCSTTLYTAAAEAPLYSLGRRRSAEKAIARLRPHIESAQRNLQQPTGEVAVAETSEHTPTAPWAQDDRG